VHKMMETSAQRLQREREREREIEIEFVRSIDQWRVELEQWNRGSGLG